MEKVSKTSDIWRLDISEENQKKGVDYASKSLPWTFNRMGIQEGPWTWYYRMMKISVGVMVQETLLSKLREDGAKIEKEWKNYRTEDNFDLISPAGTRIDVKSLNHYLEYDGDIRPTFSLDYLLKNKDYSGKEWVKFFPWMVPCDQVKRDDLFIFALLSSPNYMSEKLANRRKNFIITSPPGTWGSFYNNKKIILAREEQRKGIDLKFKLIENSTLSNVKITFHIGYEKNGKFFEEKLMLGNNQSSIIKVASSLAYIRIGKKTLPLFSGKLLVSFVNHLTESVISGGKLIDLNQPPPDKFWIVERGMFADLFLREPAKLYFIGWIDRAEFEKRRRTYPSYAYPLDAVTKLENQLGKTNEGGLLFTRSCCFIYPNVFKGGLKNKNYYVLTRDLNLMKDLSGALRK